MRGAILLFKKQNYLYYYIYGHIICKFKLLFEQYSSKLKLDFQGGMLILYPTLK